MGRFIEIRDFNIGVDDLDKYWFFKKMLNLLRGKPYKRYYRYGILADVNNNQNLRIGDRFTAGKYYPPIIFEVVKKLGKKAIIAKSVVASTLPNPDLKGKCILITKNNQPK